MTGIFKSVFGAFLLSLCSLTASAIPENQYDQVYDLLTNGRGSFYQHYSFLGERNTKIVFTKFGTSRGSKGSIVISPGRTEDSLKYLETAYDFIQEGYSPIYVINHRGQGFSERMLPDTQKGHVEDYVEYMKDFAHFMNIVLTDKNVDQGRLFGIAHSMGGSIITDYSMNYKSPFVAIAMSAPLFKIPSDSTEDKLLQDTFLACYIKFACNDYIPGGGPFTWEGRTFEKNDVTHSMTRYLYRDHLWRQWPTLQLGSPTVRWARESIQANIKRRDITRLRNVKAPFLILQAEEELVVDNGGHAPICSRMGVNKCRIEKVRGSYHEMLMEKDSIRIPVVQRMLRFFASY